MTKKKRTHTKLSIIIKKRTIGNLHPNASKQCKKIVNDAFVTIAH